MLLKNKLDVRLVFLIQFQFIFYTKDTITFLIYITVDQVLKNKLLYRIHKIASILLINILLYQMPII